jgi:iron complex transport system ATP-binding protein
VTGALLAARDLTVGYRTRRRRTAVLDGLHLALHRGRLTCLLGPNGTGKSTLLRTLVGAQPPLAGTVELLGRPLAGLGAAARARLLGVVLTDRVEVGLMTARQLVALGRTPHVGRFARLSAADSAAVDAAMAHAGVTAFADRDVAELSDGERQRVMIARALAQEPAVLVLDEPTAFLDLTRRVELVALLRELADRTGLAVLLSTHDLDLALRTADEVWLVHPGGRVETGAPEDLALSGAIAGAYAGAGIAFDHLSGTFVVAAAHGGPTVAVAGTSPARDWARRAAVRAGFTPVADPAGADAVVHVDLDAGRLRWRTDRTAGTGAAAMIAHLDSGSRIS